MSPRVLVVEDEDDNLILLNDVLRLVVGAEVLVAVDGHEAIRMAREELPDLILMDLNLPKLDGWEASRSIKRIEALRDTPIIALSAHAMVGDRESALKAGCDDYVSKPINLDEFLSVVSKYLDTGEEGKKQTSD